MSKNLKTKVDFQIHHKAIDNSQINIAAEEIVTYTHTHEKASVTHAH